MVSIKLGPLKDRGSDLLAFLEEKHDIQPGLENDIITFEDAREEPPRSSLIKTYLKRFLYREGLRKRYRVMCEKGTITP